GRQVVDGDRLVVTAYLVRGSPRELRLFHPVGRIEQQHARRDRLREETRRLVRLRRVVEDLVEALALRRQVLPDRGLPVLVPDLEADAGGLLVELERVGRALVRELGELLLLDALDVALDLGQRRALILVLLGVRAGAIELDE